MNKAILIGRLTKDPEIRVTQDGKSIGRYSMAVDRYGEGTDFINCVAFGKSAEFAEKYLSKGIKVAIEGRIQTGEYTNRDGVKVKTFDIVVDRTEFCEKKARGEVKPADDWVKTDEELPFN